MKKSIAILSSLLFISTVMADDKLPDDKFLKVCADPYMLPFSNSKEEGFENKIAELLASKLGLETKYEFFPQRMGFIRNTLRKESDDGLGHKCDLVISVPESFELAATTDPYYTSTYLLLFRKDGELAEVKKPEQLREVIETKQLKPKIGVADRGPQQLWVFKQELMQFMVPFRAQVGDVKETPGHEMVKALVEGKIDVAMVWGPTGGYYANKYKDEAELIALPMYDDPNNPQMRFNFTMAMAVRYGEKEWKETINKLLRENKAEIDKILTDYGVPLMERPEHVKLKKDDDDD